MRSLRFPVREFVTLPLAVMAYALVLHWVYANLVTELFSYLGYRFTESAPELEVLTWFMAVGVALLLPRKLDRASSVMLWILYSVTAAPAILMSTYTGYLDTATALTLSLVIALVFSAVALGTRAAVTPLRFSVSSTSFWIILGLFSAMTFGVLAYTQGLSLRFINLLDVYSVRDDYSDSSQGVGLLSYLVFTQANVVNPVVIARGIYSRRWLPVALGIIGQLVLFSGTGFKAILFSIPALIVVALMYRRRAAPSGSMFVWGSVLLMLTCAAIDGLQNSSLLTSLLSRRFLITPGVFTSAYVKFFGENPSAHLGYSVLKPWVDYPYNATPPHVIGAWMAGLPGMAANANLFADGFTNFGWAGIVGAGAILLVYLRILDRASHGLPSGVSALVVVMPAVALSNASILTSMFSHGLVVAVLLLAFAPREAWLTTSKQNADFPNQFQKRHLDQAPPSRH